MFLFEFTITACLVYHLVDKCLLKRKTKIKRSERTHKYILIEKTQIKDNQDLEDAKTLQYFFNKLRLNKQIRETNKNNEEIITKKMFNKKKNINKKLTKKIKQLEKENQELHKIIFDLKSKQKNNPPEYYNDNDINNNDDELTSTYIIPRTII